MEIETNTVVSANPVVSDEASSQEEPILRYTSNTYQRILDYHVSEILLTSIIIGVVLLLRLHR